MTSRSLFIGGGIVIGLITAALFVYGFFQSQPIVVGDSSVDISVQGNSHHQSADNLHDYFPGLTVSSVKKVSGGSTTVKCPGVPCTLTFRVDPATTTNQTITIQSYTLANGETGTDLFVSGRAWNTWSPGSGSVTRTLSNGHVYDNNLTCPLCKFYICFLGSACPGN